MATTTYQIVGNPSNILPFDVPNGTITEFDPLTGEGTFVPDNEFVGVTTFQYYLLCDNVIEAIATVTVTVAVGFCKKSVKVDVYCGSKPLSFKVKESLTNTELYVSHVQEGDRYAIYYNVPNDGLFHNFVLGVFDSTSALIATKQMLSKRCKSIVHTPTPPQNCHRPPVSCHVEVLGTIIDWSQL